ncbi:MAG: NADPH-dependent 7-cyano-7-deazaguanine reductase [marine bacterium B5-7]|nr:MAG: NADPH-dependent 7-cyano-7-deazaguanine reductase [marine bacterium B5-7]
MTDVSHSNLGKKTLYPTQYNPSLLFAIPRKKNRQSFSSSGTPLPFHGADEWNAFECSWLNPNGKPCVAIARFVFPCTSPSLIESKSFKLYLNSFNQTRFLNAEAVRDRMKNDLSSVAGAPVSVTLTDLSETPIFTSWQGICLDELNLTILAYDVCDKTLKTSDEHAEETVYSHLLKSNCPITEQPDWASVMIHYAGPRIDHAGLLQYIVSFREHAEFHEHCVEQIFLDLMRCCQPEKLTVYARYTRRGGLDINPFRSNFEEMPVAERLIRQ